MELNRSRVSFGSTPIRSYRTPLQSFVGINDLAAIRPACRRLLGSLRHCRDKAPPLLQGVGIGPTSGSIDHRSACVGKRLSNPYCQSPA